MFHLRYWAGFWIWFDFQIYQSCEYTRVLNKIFYDKCLTVFWICLGFWIRQGSKDLRLYMVLNKILHQRSLALFWILLEFWPWRCYTGFCRNQFIIHVWQSSAYSWDSHYARAWRYKGFEYANVTHDSV